MRRRTVSAGLRSEVTGGLAWTLMRLVAYGLEFLAWLALARRLEVDDVGRLAIAALVARYLGLLGDWGAHHSAAGLIAAGYRQASVQLIRHRAVMAATVALGFAAGCLLMDQPTFVPFALVALGRGANLDWVSHGHGHTGRAGVAQLLAGAGMLATALAVSDAASVAVGFGLSALGGLVVSGMAAGAAVAALQAATKPDRRSRSVEPTVGSLAWVLIMTLSDQTMATADIVVLGWLGSASEAGVYATVYRLPNAVLMVIGVVSAASVPAVARRIGRSGSGSLSASMLRRLGLGSAAVVLVLAVPFVAAVPALFGPDYRAGQPALLVLFIACAVITFSVPFRVVHLADRPGRALGQLFLVGAVVNLALNVVVIPIGGMVGAAGVTMTVQLALAVALVRQGSGRLSTGSGIEELLGGGTGGSGGDPAVQPGRSAR